MARRPEGDRYSDVRLWKGDLVKNIIVWEGPEAGVEIRNKEFVKPETKKTMIAEDVVTFYV